MRPLDFGVLWVTYGVEWKWCHYVMVETDSHLKLLPTPHKLDIYKVFEHIDMLSSGIQYQPMQLYPHYLAQIWGFWATYGVKMMSLCHGWGWQPPQSASPIHIRHIKSVWAHWYVVHWHTISALCSYTHNTTWLRFGGSGPYVSQNDLITSWLWLTATSNKPPHPY